MKILLSCFDDPLEMIRDPKLGHAGLIQRTFVAFKLAPAKTAVTVVSLLFAVYIIRRWRYKHSVVSTTVFPEPRRFILSERFNLVFKSCERFVRSVGHAIRCGYVAARNTRTLCRAARHYAPALVRTSCIVRNEYGVRTVSRRKPIRVKRWCTYEYLPVFFSVILTKKHYRVLSFWTLSHAPRASYGSYGSRHAQLRRQNWAERNTNNRSGSGTTPEGDLVL